MSWMMLIRRQIASLFRAHVDADDVAREFAFHVEMETQALMRSGMSEAEARRRAMMSFGGADRYSEELRDGWIRRIAGDALSDVRFALRGLRRTPIFSLTAIATLAVGLGGTAAVVTLIDRVLVTPLPYRDEDRVVRVFQQNSPTNRWSLSAADFLGIASWQHSFDAVTAIRFGDMALRGRGEPEWIHGGRATAGLFATFGVKASRGRLFAASDTMPDADAVVVVSDALAGREFGGADAVGRSIVLDGQARTIIGVLPRGLDNLGGVYADVWSLMRVEQPNRRGPFGFAVYARMKQDATLDAARTDLSSISDRLLPMYMPGFSDKTARLTPYRIREVLFGDAQKSLRVLAVAVLFVLLIALANVTNLVLVRSSARRREMALRVALGAGRVRLMRLLVIENLVLSLLGGLFAIAVAAGVLGSFRAIGPTMPRIESAHVGGTTVLSILLLSCVCGLAIALYPIALGRPGSVGTALQGGSRRTSSGRGTRFFQGGLVVAEFALALPLFAGAALLLHSYAALQQVDTGVDATNVLTMRVTLPATQYRDASKRIEFWNAALREAATIPGIESVGISSSLPPDNQGETNNFNLVDHPVPAGAAEPTSPWGAATPGYFASLHVKLLAGRMFDDRDDDPNALPVLIVSRAWAERWFPNQSVVGRQLVEGGCVECPHSTVIGVVGDIKYAGLEGNGEGVYNPYSQSPSSNMYFVARARGDARALVAPLRARLRAIDPTLPLSDAELLSDHLGSAITDPRHWTQMVGGFALIAIVLAALGVFGVMSYIVAQQQREIGVRLAIGATPRGVLALVLKRGIALASAGVLLGVIGAMQGGRVLRHVLYETSASDPRLILLVAAVMLGVATIACYFPGRRAARVDPVKVISAD